MMEQYIMQWQNTVAQYIATRSLLYMCEGSERTLGARVGMRWWEQADTNMERAREAAVAEAEAKKDEVEEWQEDSRDGAPEDSTRRKLN